MKITKSQLRQLIQEVIQEQIDTGDVLQRNLGGEGKNILNEFIQAMQEATKAWSDLHKYFDPSEEADEAMIEELKREVDLVDDNLLAWLEQVALKAKATV